MKTIGVLGGQGPQATMDFEARVHRIAQGLIPQQGPLGYPPMVVLYYRSFAFAATDEGRPVQPLQVNPAFLDAAATLGAAADFLVITSNFTHMFRDDVASASGRPVLNMIDETLAEVERRAWSRVGVLGYGDPVVYTRRLSAHETVDGDLRTELDASILKLMEGRADDAARNAAAAAVAELRGRGVDGIVLGCTEITLLLGDAAKEPDLIDPLELLAQAAVRFALAD